MWWRAYTNIYSEALNVVTRVLTIEGSGNPVERYPQLFAGLGKLEGEYSIRLEKGAQPYYALSVPTDIPICPQCSCDILIPLFTQHSLESSIESLNHTITLGVMCSGVEFPDA